MHEHTPDAMHKMLQLLGLLVTAGLLSPCNCMAKTFHGHVAPALPAADCPEPCHTLDQYAQNQSFILAGYNNITLIFLEGVHNLNDSFVVYTNLIILQPALPNQQQRPKVVGRFDAYYRLLVIKA